jgi:iron complex outermembrane receptor protein
MALPQGGTSQGNIAGNRLPNAPRWKGTATIDYRTPIGGGVDITGNIFYRYQSSVIYDLLGNPNTRQKGYGVLNLRAGLASSDSGWSLDFFVNNVTNKHFLVGISDASNRFTAPAGTVAPTTLVARYDRASFRYGGVRATLAF